MNNLSYIQLLNRTLEIYLDKSAEEAFEFIESNYVGIIGNEAQIYNFRYALSAASGLKEVAMDLLREAVIEKGYWYSFDYLRKDQDLKILRKEAEFKNILNICKDREKISKASNEFEVKLSDLNEMHTLKSFLEKKDEISSKSKENLLISFHGDQESVKTIEPYWKSKSLDKYSKVFPQSREILFSDAYGWDDLEKCSDEIKELDESLSLIWSKDNKVVGGFSAGARIALYSLLLDKIDAKGFIFVAPWLPEIQSWDMLFEKLSGRGIKFYIICGENDEDCYESTLDFIETLNAYEIDHMFRAVENLDHDYPENFSEIIDEAMKFINS